ncbi:hypothetical protein Q428_12055 [Fervidicella metallireducens AeB]|uniref:Uncharacterized protein n=1 Tax=Fervidicella metallireducens AeB TaxID=1403537 RepID=A0A017RSE8_9CLOT|nr:hypothetical protein [Fervidicella metallireducens]EYE87688.1 hypothetical protein Q428_12055 [Fervidicella metallireducens AeB]
MEIDLFTEFKERIGTEYEILKKCLKYYDSDSLDVREYSNQENDKVLLKMEMRESIRDSVAKSITQELFLPLVFVNLFKILDELLIYAYGVSMGKIINPYMGYTLKSNLFLGQDVEFKKEKYSGLDMSKLVVCKDLNILCDKSWCQKYIKLYSNLYEKRNTLVHNKYLVEDNKIKFYTGSGQTEELSFDDIYYLMQVILYGVDQVINTESYRKFSRIDYYYGSLSFISNNTNNFNKFIPGLICVIKCECTELNKLKEDVEKLRNRIVNTNKHEIDYLKIIHNKIEYLIPFDVYERITDNVNLKDLEEYKSKNVNDYEELRDL